MFVHFTDAELLPGDEVTSAYSRSAMCRERSLGSSTYSPLHVYFMGEEALQKPRYHRLFGQYAYEVEPTEMWEKDIDPHAPEYAWRSQFPLRVVGLVQTGGE